MSFVAAARSSSKAPSSLGAIRKEFRPAQIGERQNARSKQPSHKGVNIEESIHAYRSNDVRGCVCYVHDLMPRGGRRGEPSTSKLLEMRTTRFRPPLDKL